MLSLYTARPPSLLAFGVQSACPCLVLCRCPPSQRRGALPERVRICKSCCTGLVAFHGGSHCIHWFVSNRRSSEPLRRSASSRSSRLSCGFAVFSWAAKHQHAASVCYRQGSASVLVNERSSRRRLPANDRETGMTWSPDCHFSLFCDAARCDGSRPIKLPFVRVAEQLSSVQYCRQPAVSIVQIWGSCCSIGPRLWPASPLSSATAGDRDSGVSSITLSLVCITEPPDSCIRLFCRCPPTSAQNPRPVSLVARQGAAPECNGRAMNSGTAPSHQHSCAKVRGSQR